VAVGLRKNYEGNARKNAEILLQIFVTQQKCAEPLTPLPTTRHGTVLKPRL